MHGCNRVARKDFGRNAPGDSETAGDIRGRLGQRKRANFPAKRNPLLELTKSRLIQPVGEFGLANQEHIEQLVRRCLDIAEEPYFLEQLRRQTLSFIEE